MLVLGDPTVGHQGGCSAGAWDLDLNDNSKSALGESISPTGGHHGLPHQPPASSRLSLGHHRRLCSSSKGQTHENSNEASSHDYLPLVRTGEVEGSTIRARALSQLPLPPPLLSSGTTARGARLLPPGRTLLCRCEHSSGTPVSSLALCCTPRQPQPHLNLISLGISGPWCWPR